MNPRFTNALPNNQKGVTLIVGLIMLLLLTMIGVSGIQDTNMQERMAMNVRDKNVALQGAEAGLRAAESTLVNISLSNFDNTGGYLNPNNSPNSRPYDPSYLAGDVSTSQFNWSNYGKETSNVDNNLVEAPRWIVERLPNELCADSSGTGSVTAGSKSGECEKYRVTSRSFGITSNTQVILQSTVRRSF